MLIETVSSFHTAHRHNMFLKRSSGFLLRNSNCLRENFVSANLTPFQTSDRSIFISSIVSYRKISEKKLQLELEECLPKLESLSVLDDT